MDSMQEAYNRYRKKMKQSYLMEDSELDDPEAEGIELVTIRFVQCQKCGVAEKKTEFDFHGARLNDCRCKLGEEDWQVVTMEVEQDDPRRNIKPPAPR